MDPDIARWILEFLLRSSVPDRILKKIFMVLPLSGLDSQLQKTLLLRGIQSEVAKASLTETLLESLEIIEELDRVDGIAITETMKQAYCAVAVDCTIRYLEASPDDDDDNNQALYFDAVKTIWRGRVRQMEEEAAVSGKTSQFLTAELIKWRDDIEAALWDSNVCERLANTNSIRNALDKVRAYLAETWAFMGPSFLELAAQLSEEKGSSSLSSYEDKMGEVPGGLATDKHDAGCEKCVPESVLAADPINVCEGKLQCSTNPVEDLVASDRIEMHNAPICTEKVPAASGNRDSEQLEEKAVSLVDGSQELDGIDLPPQIEGAIQKKDELPLKRKHTTACTRHKGVKILDADHDRVSSLLVKKLRESLKSSSLELRALVKDPLPEALHKSDIVRSELEMKGMSHKQPPENQSIDADVPEPNSCRSIVLYQPNDAILKKQSSDNRSNVHRPSLMERNSTAHTYEWDDSINDLPGGTPKKRRKAKRWSSLEEETLRAGVKKFGKGSWKSILDFYGEIFKKTGRTDGDLKDKWRNMTR